MSIHGKRNAAAPITESLESRRLFDLVAPGGIDTGELAEMAEYSLRSKWTQPGGLGSAVNLGYSFSNLLDAGAMPGGLSATLLKSAIEEALQVWSAVAPLKFSKAIDAGPMPSDTDYTANGAPELRFGSHLLDGPLNVLGHAYFPGGTGLAGDVHFDNGDTWSIVPEAGAFDIIETATHEIGHALGLDHFNSLPAIMNPKYVGRFSGLGTAYLLNDDINGIQAQYGAGLGYVISDGVLYVSGTESADTLGVNASGSGITLTRGAYSTTALAAGITKIVVNSRGGDDTINVQSSVAIDVFVHSGGGSDTVNVNTDNTGTASVIFDQNDESLGTLKIGAGGLARLAATAAAGDNVLTLNTLSITSGGTFDISNGAFILDYTSSTPFDDVQQLLVGGFNNGAWNGGSGIVSSTAAASEIGLLYSLPYAESSALFGITGSQTAKFLDRTVDSTALLVRFTYTGDADLNGTVNGDDYWAIDSNVLQSGSVFGYQNGDFDYNGEINGDDYFFIDSNITQQGAALKA